MLDWLIIGGGVHGYLIAHTLLRFGQAAPDRIAIVDPNEKPLARWMQQTHNCGMRYLRSPAAHAMVPDFTALLRWARAHGYPLEEHTIPPYSRPSLELFNAHARAVIETSGAGPRWIRDTAVSIERPTRNTCWETTGRSGERYRSARVVLAPGRSPGLRVPQWARESGLLGSRIVHVFDEAFDLARAEAASQTTIVGGGVSAVHLALHLCAAGGHVRLITRHEIDVHQFDSEPCFIGPSCMKRYVSTADPEKRRAMLNEARHPGSVPPELARRLEEARATGAIEVVVDEPTGARAVAGESELTILATGFEDGPPLPEVVKEIVRRYSVRVDSAGYPIPTPGLEWTDGLYVTGALAEQELGPSAPNIIGAHNAAKRIIAGLRGAPRPIPGAWRRYAPASVSSSSDSN